MKEPLVRFSVAIGGELLRRFDQYREKHRYPNRSEAVRGLMRDALIEEAVETEESEAENGGVVPDGGEVIEEYTVELELDAGKSDVSTTVVVDREAEPSTKLLGTEVELDGAVVVSTTVGV